MHNIPFISIHIIILSQYPQLSEYRNINVYEVVKKTKKNNDNLKYNVCGLI